MPTLYVENFPADLHTALRKRAKAEGRSLSAEVISLLRERIPTSAELAHRRRALQTIRELTSRRPVVASASFETAEELIQVDRNRDHR